MKFQDYMRQIFCTTLLSFVLGCAYAQQPLDTTAYQFVYDVQAKVFEQSKKLIPDEHVLELGRNGVSKYYSRWKERNYQVIDSVCRIGGSFDDARRILQAEGVESFQFCYSVYKNYPHAGQQTVDYVSMELFQYQESMGQEWNLIEGDTIILDHPCQKATCHYHSRTWTAYYATDIPISEGPWKLCGLPGLILKAYDSDGAFVFNCIGIQQGTGTPMTMRETTRRKMKPEQAHKVIELIDSNPDAYLESHGQKVQTFDEKGRLSKMPKLPKRAYYESYSAHTPAMSADPEL